MSEFMRSSDAFTWAMESDPRLRSTVVTVLLLEKSPNWDHVRARMDLISRRLPMFRQRVVESALDPQTERALHRTIDGVRSDMDGLRFNTAIAKLIELTNRATAISASGTPRALIEPLVLMLAPFAPHVGEELWHRLGHVGSLAYVDYPTADPALLVAESVTYPVQVNGKVRGRIEVAADATEEAVRQAALAEVAGALEGREPRKVIVVAGRMVSVVAVSMR